jgi:stress response protein YsnF
MEEQVQVTKRIVPLERVRLRKEVVRLEREVQDSVRKEQVTVEGVAERSASAAPDAPSPPG